MKSITAQLDGWFVAALRKVSDDPSAPADPQIRPAGDEKHGDYQSNIAMGLAKRLGQKPRDVAQRIVDALSPEVGEMCEPFEIAGPGFINIRLRNEWLARSLAAIPPEEAPDRLGIEKAVQPQHVVVDYSGPNIAKQMHVGHLRSTIIGDTIARVLDFEGHTVARQNHLGDWGTQFGVLCAYLKQKMPAVIEGTAGIHLADLEDFYRQATALDKQDPAFHERARAEVVALHNHEPTTLKAWRYIVEESRRHYMPIYKRLGVLLTPEDERGESFYADRLPAVVAELEQRFRQRPADGGIHVEVSDGALCVFHWKPGGEPEFKNPEGKPQPMIIRKSDGAYIYAATDLAAMKFRMDELKADRVIYVTDARQAQHFQMVFSAVRAAGWTRRAESRAEAILEHVPFGSILGPDRKPLKTRSGENIKLADLLSEAVSRAEELIRVTEADPQRKRGFGEEEIQEIAEAVGIGAVKYADLSMNLQTDYVFSWDKMLALDGNTAPYLMYAYARIRSIYRKASQDEKGDAAGFQETNRIPVSFLPPERTLARQILRFVETIDSVAASLKLNLLTDYLYGLAVAFTRFYEACPVLKADTNEQRASRLRLCDLTVRHPANRT